MTDNDQPVGRRGLIDRVRPAGLLHLLAATGGPAGATTVAPPAVDPAFTDFSLIKINSDDDSLTRIQKKGLVVSTSNDWPYSFLDPKMPTNAVLMKLRAM